MKGELCLASELRDPFPSLTTKGREKLHKKVFRRLRPRVAVTRNSFQTTKDRQHKKIIKSIQNGLSAKGGVAS